MREIKFRAWDKTNKKMCHVWDIGWKAWDNPGVLNGVTVEAYGKDADGTYQLLEGQVELMQFTGLKDKNGKDIYEGDIVRYRDPNHSSSRDYDYLVEWTDDYCGFDPFACYDSDCGEYTLSKDCQIIGNIYDNPELLK